MGFFKRLKNVIEAKANKALDKHENPIEMLELSINKKERGCALHTTSFAVLLFYNYSQLFFFMKSMISEM